jgi:hypothetical protein
MSGKRIYSIWNDMRKRCDNKIKETWPNYGGRGISYNPEWKDFNNFYKDMGESYSDNLSLERIDVNGDYSKENCEWIPLSEQAKNKRKYSSNTLGVAGCSIFESKGRLYVRARLQDSDTKKRISKLFSLKDFTLEDCLLLAEEWLKEQRVIFGYKETHGNEG